MSGNNIARKIQRRLLRDGKLTEAQYTALRKLKPAREGHHYHPTKGFRKA